MLKPTNCGNLLGAKCGVECLNGYEEKQPSPPRECEKSEHDLAYWTGEETNCIGKHQTPAVQGWITLCTGLFAIQWINVNKTNYAIHWIVIYPEDSDIHTLNTERL